MRTTVDIPDDLYRHAKSQAALQGKRLRDLVEEGLRRVLGIPLPQPSARRVEFPLHRSRLPGALTPEAVSHGEEDMQFDEDRTHGRSV